MIYRPIMVINFRLRFDEAYFSPEVNLAPIPMELDDIKTPIPAAEFSLLPQFMYGKRDDLSYIMSIVPRRANVELAGYRQAGKWSADVDFKNFPIDPRVLRACSVEIHLGTISDADWAEGNTKPPPPGQPRKTILQTRINGAIRKDTLLMIGLVDTITMSHSASGSIVTLEGRDNRCILLDTPVRPTLLRKLKLNKSIDDVVHQIVSLHPYTAGINVAVQPGDWDVPETAPSPAVKGDLTRWRADSGDQPYMGMAGDPNQLNMWDVITRYCFLVGAIPFFDGEDLWIRRSRSLYDQVTPTEKDQNRTPFKDGKPREIQGENGSFPTNIRVFAYGRDVLSFKMERKIQGPITPVVELVSTDSNNTKRGLQSALVIARWPQLASNPITGTPKQALEQNPLGAIAGATAGSFFQRGNLRAQASGKSVAKQKATVVSPSGQLAMTQVLRIPVHGIRSQARLLQMAKDIYHEVAHGEIGGSVSTRNLSSLGGDATDPDVIRLRPGDAVRIIVDARELKSFPAPVSDYIEFTRQSTRERTEFLVRRFGDQKLANALSVAQGGIDQLATIFRTSNVKFTWDIGQGVAIDFDFQNYINVRGDVDTAPKTLHKPRKKTVGSAVVVNKAFPPPNGEVINFGFPPDGGARRVRSERNTDVEHIINGQFLPFGR